MTDKQNIYNLGCFFCPGLFQIPTQNSPVLDFGEKITPAMFREKFLTFHLGRFALKFMKSLTNQNFQNVARILVFFFKTFLIQKLDRNVTPKIGSYKNLPLIFGI